MVRVYTAGPRPSQTTLHLEKLESRVAAGTFRGQFGSLAPIESRYNGPDWLTGGVFGPEDSVITIGVMSASIVLLIAAAYKRNRITTA